MKIHMKTFGPPRKVDQSAFGDPNLIGGCISRSDVECFGRKPPHPEYLFQARGGFYRGEGPAISMLYVSSWGRNEAEAATDLKKQMDAIVDFFGGAEILEG